MKEIVQAVEQQYLTKPQAQIYTGLSARSLDYARERGELPWIKYGKRVLLKRTDLDTMLERHRAVANLDRLVDETLAELGVGK